MIYEQGYWPFVNSIKWTFSLSLFKATTTATIYPRAGGRAGISSGGYAFNPFICDNGDAAPTPDDNQPKQTKPKRPPKKVEVKPPTTNYSRESSTSSDQGLKISCICQRVATCNITPIILWGKSYFGNFWKLWHIFLFIQILQKKPSPLSFFLGCFH